MLVPQRQSMRRKLSKTQKYDVRFNIVLTPSGMNCPAMTAPPFGVTLGKPPGTAGYKRVTSIRTAQRYGILSFLAFL